MADSEKNRSDFSLENNSVVGAVQDAIRLVQDSDFTRASANRTDLYAALKTLKDVKDTLLALHTSQPQRPAENSEEAAEAEKLIVHISALLDGVTYRKNNLLPPIQAQKYRIEQLLPRINTQEGRTEIIERLLALAQQPDAADTVAELKVAVGEAQEQFESIDLVDPRIDIAELRSEADALLTGSATLYAATVAERIYRFTLVTEKLQQARALFSVFGLESLQHEVWRVLSLTLDGLQESVISDLILHHTSRSGSEYLEELSPVPFAQYSRKIVQDMTELLRNKADGILSTEERDALNQETSESENIVRSILKKMFRGATASNERSSHSSSRVQSELDRITAALAVLSSPTMELLLVVNAKREELLQ